MRFDTLHIALDEFTDFKVNPDLMFRGTSQRKARDSDEVLTVVNYQYVSKGESLTDRPTGIQNIDFNPDTHRSTIKVSAKCLGNEYPEGIHYGNIDRVADVINSTGVISIHPSELVNGLIRRADAVVNLDIGHTRIPEYLNAVRTLQDNTRYKFDTSHKTTVEIQTRRGKGKTKLRVYGKRDELATAANREFLEQYPKCSRPWKTAYVLSVKAGILSTFVGSLVANSKADNLPGS